MISARQAVVEVPTAIIAVASDMSNIIRVFAASRVHDADLNCVMIEYWLFKKASAHVWWVTNVFHVLACFFSSKLVKCRQVINGLIKSAGIWPMLLRISSNIAKFDFKQCAVARGHCCVTKYVQSKTVLCRFGASNMQECVCRRSIRPALNAFLPKRRAGITRALLKTRSLAVYRVNR